MAKKLQYSIQLISLSGANKIDKISDKSDV